MISGQRNLTVRCAARQSNNERQFRNSPDKNIREKSKK
jgi:hypothetical protein